MKLNELGRLNPVRLYCDRLLNSGQAHVKISYEINPNLQAVSLIVIQSLPPD